MHSFVVLWLYEKGVYCKKPVGKLFARIYLREILVFLTISVGAAWTTIHKGILISMKGIS